MPRLFGAVVTLRLVKLHRFIWDRSKSNSVETSWCIICLLLGHCLWLSIFIRVPEDLSCWRLVGVVWPVIGSGRLHRSVIVYCSLFLSDGRNVHLSPLIPQDTSGSKVQTLGSTARLDEMLSLPSNADTCIFCVRTQRIRPFPSGLIPLDCKVDYKMEKLSTRCTNG